MADLAMPAKDKPNPHKRQKAKLLSEQADKQTNAANPIQMKN
jgi:hypothetical protein